MAGRAAADSVPERVGTWVAGISDRDLAGLVTEMQEFSRHLEEECARCGLAYFDTGVSIGDALREARSTCFVERADERQLGVHSNNEGGSVTAEGERLIAAWRTNDRATAYLVRHLPAGVWAKQVPGIPRLTVGMIAAHIHNSRCWWIKSLGARHGVRVPRLVDLRRVQPGELLQALSRSSRGMTELIGLGVANGGRVPRATWQNFPTDLEHFLSYFAAHEGHHRGQLCMAVRQLGQRLPRNVASGIWQWTRLARGSG